MKTILMISSVVISVLSLDENRPDLGAENVDRYLTSLELITKYGYPAENHTVISEDGYILTLHRIPYGRTCPKEKSKGPVLLQHGLFCSSADFLISGTARGLGYILADECYDVWMPNSRGNRYSKAHVKLNTYSSDYWSFSWHEMGKYDIPAIIDYILETTGESDLFYIGHSQGTTQFFIFNSLHPDYTDKVRAAFMLAPIAFMGHCQSFVLRFISSFATGIGFMAKMIGFNEFLPHKEFISDLGAAFCSDTQPITPQICQNVLFLACGYDSKQMNETLLPILLGHTPAGCAARQLLHYAQNINTGEFKEYDFGTIKNPFVYRQFKPPEYDLSQVQIPTTLVYSLNDWLAAVEDVEILASRLGNLREKILVPFKKFNHLDYLYAIDVVPLVYDTVLDRMNKIEKIK